MKRLIPLLFLLLAATPAWAHNAAQPALPLTPAAITASPSIIEEYPNTEANVSAPQEIRCTPAPTATPIATPPPTGDPLDPPVRRLEYFSVGSPAGSPDYWRDPDGSWRTSYLYMLYADPASRQGLRIWTDTAGLVDVHGWTTWQRDGSAVVLLPEEMPGSGIKGFALVFGGIRSDVDWMPWSWVGEGITRTIAGVAAAPPALPALRYRSYLPLVMR